jgi:hypothetical protein
MNREMKRETNCEMKGEMNRGRSILLITGYQLATNKRREMSRETKRGNES